MMSGNQTPALTFEQFTEILHPSDKNIMEIEPLPRYHSFALAIIGHNTYLSPIFDEVRERRPDLAGKVNDALENHDWSKSISQKLRPHAEELYQEYLTMRDEYGHSDEDLNLKIYL